MDRGGCVLGPSEGSLLNFGHEKICHLFIYLFVFSAKPRDTAMGADKQRTKQKGTDGFVFQ